MRTVKYDRNFDFIRKYSDIKDALIEALVECDIHFGEKSVISTDVKRQVSKYLNWRIDKESKKKRREEIRIKKINIIKNRQRRMYQPFVLIKTVSSF
jgi:hypothetical protein